MQISAQERAGITKEQLKALSSNQNTQSVNIKSLLRKHNQFRGYFSYRDPEMPAKTLGETLLTAMNGGDSKQKIYEIEIKTV